MCYGEHDTINIEKSSYDVLNIELFEKTLIDFNGSNIGVMKGKINGCSKIKNFIVQSEIYCEIYGLSSVQYEKKK